MRAAVIGGRHQIVAPNVTVEEDWPDPAPGPGEVVVRTEAAALNQLDLWVGRGVPGIDLEYPRISGSDGCGRVEAIGTGVEEGWIGRRVILNAAIPRPDPIDPDVLPALDRYEVIGEHRQGTMAERFVAPVDHVLDVGEADPVEAAAFGLAHLTAWRMLIARAHLRAGQTVLITGIGGGVSQALLNIALHLGCPVVVTSRHQWKLDRALALGARHAVLDEGEDWSRAVRSATGKRGVDVCADSIGRIVHMPCIKTLARGGTFVTCGCTTGPDAVTDLARIFWNQLTVAGSTMGSMADFREVVSLFRHGAMRPVVDSVFDAADARRAYERLESGEQFGKVVVRWS